MVGTVEGEETGWSQRASIKAIEAIEAIATAIRAVGASIYAAKAAIEAAISLLLMILTRLKGGRATQIHKFNEVEESCLEEPSSMALGNGRWFMAIMGMH
jgi:hypothetical protein